MRKKKTRKKRSRYKTGIHESVKLLNGPAKYRSGWEVKYMLWLDANDNVKSYEYEAFSIPYVSNKKSGRVRKYFPDIYVHYVDETHRLVEVKPTRKLKLTINKKKLEAAEVWCCAHGVTLEIVTEVTLKVLGVL